MTGAEKMILAGVWGTFALDCYSTFCSSPQTAEINIDKREESLMYWVKWGGGFAVGTAAVASLYAKSLWPIIGAGFVALVLWLLYGHAKNRGKERSAGNGANGTETY